MMKGNFCMEIRKSNLVYKTYLIFLKEIKCEWRTKVSINSLFLFSFVLIFLISYSIGPYKIPENYKNDFLSALLMISLFFSASVGLSRAFLKEEEQKTSITTKVSQDPVSLFIGKLLFNLILIFLISLVITPIFFTIMEFYVKNLCLFLINMFFSMLGLSIVLTFVSAIISKASVKGVLFPILSFPILIPLIIESIRAMSFSASFADYGLPFKSFFSLVSYSGVTFFGSLILFERIWKE